MKTVFSATDSGAGHQVPALDGGLELCVLFTTVPKTLDALRSAQDLAQGLSARIRLLVLHVVSYALPLDRPSVHPAILANRYGSLCTKGGIDITVDIRFCRERWEGLRSALVRPSVVMVGGRRSWWPSEERRLIRRLQDAGHTVMRCESKRGSH